MNNRPAKSQTKKNRGAIPVSFVAVLHNVLKRMMADLKHHVNTLLLAPVAGNG